MENVIRKALTAPFEDHELDVHEFSETERSVTINPTALRKRLYEVFGFRWSQTTSELEVSDTHAQCEVTVTHPYQHRTAYGSMIIESGRVDNAIKASETNGFVRCCAMLGMEPTLEQIANVKTGKPKDFDRGEVQAQLEKLAEKEAFNQSQEIENEDEVEQGHQQEQEDEVANQEEEQQEVKPKKLSAKEKEEYSKVLEHLGEELIEAGKKEWNVEFADKLFTGMFTGGEVRSALRAMQLNGLEQCLARVVRFTRQAGLQFYNEFMGKTDEWAERQMKEYLDSLESQETPEKDKPSTEEVPKQEPPKEEKKEEPIKESKPEKTTPFDEEVKGEIGEVKTGEIPVDLLEPMDQERIIDVIFNIADRFEENEIDSDNYSKKVRKEILEVFPTMTDFLKMAKDGLIPYVIG